MEHEQNTDWYAYQKAALKILCQYLGNSPASPLTPDTAHTQPHEKASAPGGGGLRSAPRHSLKPAPAAAGRLRVFSDFCASHASSPWAPLLNVTDVAKGLQRKRLPEVPPSVKTAGGLLCEPPKQLAAPGKALVSLWNAATHAHRGTALLVDTRGCSVAFREDERGAGWGTMLLVPGGEKPLRYTDHFHYIFYVVAGAAVVTFGDMYAVPCSERTVRERGLWEVQRGNYYGLRNNSAAAPATIFFAQVCRFGNAKGGQHAADMQDGGMQQQA